MKNPAYFSRQNRCQSIFTTFTIALFSYVAYSLGNQYNLFPVELLIVGGLGGALVGIFFGKNICREDKPRVWFKNIPAENNHTEDEFFMRIAIYNENNEEVNGLKMELKTVPDINPPNPGLLEFTRDGTNDSNEVEVPVPIRKPTGVIFPPRGYPYDFAIESVLFTKTDPDDSHSTNEPRDP